MFLLAEHRGSLPHCRRYPHIPPLKNKVFSAEWLKAWKAKSHLEPQKNPFLALFSWTCSKNITHSMLVGLPLSRNVDVNCSWASAFDLYQATCITQPCRATYRWKAAKSTAWLPCVNSSIIWGLFALVWPMHVFVLKYYRRWKGSTHNKNGTEIYSWLDHSVYVIT